MLTACGAKARAWLPKVWKALTWQPFTHAVLLVGPDQSRRWALAKHIAWSIALRLALLPVPVLIFWVILLVCLTHPGQRPVQVFPEQYSLYYENVEFTTTDGVRISGWYVNSLKPSDVLNDDRWRRLRPAVVLCHGYGARRDETLYPLATELVDRGYDVLLFDFRGHGHSDRAPVSFGLTEASDVVAAVEFLRGRAGVDRDRIGIFGVGMGGYAAILAAPHCAGVRCVIADSVYPSIETMLQRKTGQTAAPSTLGTTLAWGLSLYYGFRLIDHTAVEAVREFDDRGLLMVTGAEDELTPAEDLRPVLSAAGPKASSLVVARAGHGQALADPMTKNVILQYLDAYLSQPQAAQASLLTALP